MGKGGARRLADNVAPGWMCPTSSLTEDQLKPYEFKHCKGEVEVGKSYEVHYVHSSAGYRADQIANAKYDLDDGLGGAANGRGLLNPMVVVQGQVYQIVNDANCPSTDDMLHGWTVIGHENAVMYAGSTTGPSHNNEVCSPYAITWHVDLDCHKICAASFDKMCMDMKNLYGLENDLYP